MDTGRIILKKKEYEDYIYMARPCVEMTDEAVRQLCDDAGEAGLEFAGVVSGHVEVLDKVDYGITLDLGSSPVHSIMVRNICAGVYRKDFLAEHGIELRTDENTIFPDLDVLWQVFVYARKAQFVESSLCENIESDTVLIEDTAAAFDVNRRYDYVRDILMADWDRWQMWKPYFCLQRFRCYYEILHWMKDDVAWDFAERMAVELHRSRELEEMDDSLFTLEEQTALRLNDIDAGFFKRYFLGKVMLTSRLNSEKRRADDLERQVAMLEEELKKQKENYENSTTYRVGKAIMYVPISAKKMLRHEKSQGE